MAVKNLRSGTVLTSAIGLNMFSDDELEKIHRATLEILWEMGVKVESTQALEIFDGIGCIVDRKNRIVKIPAHLVEDAISSCPSTFKACVRNSEKKIGGQQNVRRSGSPRIDLNGHFNGIGRCQPHLRPRDA